jgi:hypothetical protein
VRVRAGLTVLVAVVVATAVGCTSGGGDDARAPAAATATTVHHMTTTQTDLAADATPREVRARFEQLLGQHALLAMRLARSEADKAPDLQKVVQGSLDANTGAIQQAVGVTFDGAQADRFQQLWKGYTDDLAAYANSAASLAGRPALARLVPAP